MTRALELDRRTSPGRPLTGRSRPHRTGSGTAAGVIWPLQRTAGNQAVIRLLGGRTRPFPPVGSLQRFEAGEHDGAVALSDQQAAQLARFPAAALRRWSQLTQDQRDSVLWKMISLYGPDFAADFQNYAAGGKAPNLSTDVSNDPALTPGVLTARGYRKAGDVGGIPTWVHPSGHEIRLLSRGKAPDEPAGCPDPDVGACVTDSADEDSCNDCCDQRYHDDEVCRRTCKAGCADKL
jgi:hypothetical protein